MRGLERLSTQPSGVPAPVAAGEVTWQVSGDAGREDEAETSRMAEGVHQVHPKKTCTKRHDNGRRSGRLGSLRQDGTLGRGNRR